MTADDLTGKLAAIHDQLPEYEREWYLKALQSPACSADKLSHALASFFGLSVSATTIKAWRRRHAKEGING